MKIITWNCNLDFLKKVESALAHKLDILIIKECKNLDKLKFDSKIQLPAALLWNGKFSCKL
ncbi:hypothetical protein [Flavobacterium taihuense]|uniref:Endonuclease/exonuclease/phosphatase family protein n=1 Tax=Flavobacterium taihuense TaxID=2857508 RepID=A0ABS6XWH0_9FLAO|nr:hypothetical protein [Flavobacterium taihuense]MBW4360909.1 hypothetical protein [Flavobacterium taihuense]